MNELSRNTLHTLLLVTGMVLLMALLGFSLAGWVGVWWACALAGALFLFTPRVTPQVMLSMYGARPLAPQDMPALYEVLVELTRRAGLESAPRLFYIRSNMMNAFTMGTSESAAIALTDGMLRALSLRELTGVLAHELSHVRNNDIRVMSLADVVSRVTSGFSMVGQFLLLINLPLLLLGGYTIPWLPILILLFTPMVTALMQLALSRTRELDADVAAARLSADPEGLASALLKLEARQASLLERIFLPGKREPHPSVLRTHPLTDERVKRLLAMAPMQEEPVHAMLGRRLHQPPDRFAPVPRPPRWRVGGFWY